VGDALTAVQLREADFDLCEEHQTFDRVIDSGIGRQFPNGLDHPIPCDWRRHDASILALILYVNNGSAPRVEPAHQTFDDSAPPPDWIHSPEPHADAIPMTLTRGAARCDFSSSRVDS
jgi:hypothetical protein